jgi:DnaJ-class molecular chaperone
VSKRNTCRNCKGTGFIFLLDPSTWKSTAKQVCSICRGSGRKQKLQ